MAGSTVSGGIWRANYGEVTEIQQFRLGPVSGIGWDATLPIRQLTDLASILSTVGSVGMDVIVRGTELQAWKETDGFFTDIVVGPRLDSGKPAQIFRFFIDKLSDLLYVLNLLMADIQNTYPDDWDFSTFPKAVVVGPGGVIDSDLLPRQEMDSWYALKGEGDSTYISDNGDGTFTLASEHLLVDEGDGVFTLTSGA